MYSLISHAAFSVTPNAGDLTDNVPTTTKLASIRSRLVTRLSHSVYYDRRTGGTKVPRNFWNTLYYTVVLFMQGLERRPEPNYNASFSNLCC